jgi:anti-sigma regulatory factor (Ser/Thr protein kinase)
MTSEDDVGSADGSPLTAGVDLPLGGHAAALARRTVADVLHTWWLRDEAWIYDALLLTSELVGNAVRHGGTRVALELSLDTRHLQIAVSDGCSVLPAQRGAGDADESGRGLMIIQAIASDWGVQETDGGKRVWVRLPVPATAPPRRTGEFGPDNIVASPAAVTVG